MAQVHSETTGLQSQYSAQLTADLERNTKEQERISAEVTSLQELLEALRRDQALLVNLQRTLGDDAPGAGEKAAGPAAAVPSVPRQTTAGPKSKAKPAKQQAAPAKAAPAKAASTKTAPAKTVSAKATPVKDAPAKAASSKATPVKAASSKATPAKAATPKAAAKAPEAAGKPTLVELIHDHLSRQSEPRSAAEITTTLSESHPERGIKATVVRTTVEGLVAKGRAQRSKQGTSVYYTAAGTGAVDGSAKQPAAEQKTPATD
ncbi:MULTISPECIES: hypothetical protein [unclassified Streptomyces]|uniref:hypothetical protein n=1 Tax=unclassified Streptomyces TaxID=2593676 RepID=UPI002E362398|nr:MULTISPECIES: hypothetical protein [unclassified Streptomyces]